MFYEKWVHSALGSMERPSDRGGLVKESNHSRTTIYHKNPKWKKPLARAWRGADMDTAHGYLGPFYTQDWEPVTFTLWAFSLVAKVEPVQVRFTLRLRDQWSMWMHDGCKVYMDSYMALNGSCFTITLKNTLGGRSNTNPGDHALWTFTTVALFYFIMCEDPHKWKFYLSNSIWLRARSHMTSHYTWGSVTTLHNFGGVLGRPLDTFFCNGLSQSPGHGPWLECEVVRSKIGMGRVRGFPCEIF